MRLSLTIQSTNLARICAHAQQGYPLEVCGLIGGRNGIAQTIVPIANIATTPRVRFEMDHGAMVKAILGFEKARQDVVAIYHSHPDEAGMPSRFDIAEATWPDAVYLIIGFAGSPQPDVRAWMLHRGRADAAILTVIDAG